MTSSIWFLTFLLILASLSSCAPHESQFTRPAPQALPAMDAQPSEPPGSPTTPPTSDDLTAVDLDPEALLSTDLLDYHKKEILNLTADDILRKNEALVAALYNQPIYEDIRIRKKRVGAIQAETANKLMKSMDSHPVVAYYANYKYNRPQTDIGYCFGRATYAHLALLKLGVAKESIRKAWIVGPMQTTSTLWAFHVTTLVRSLDGKWYAIDNQAGGQLLELHDWLKYFSRYNKDHQNLRLYITSPQKFTATLAKYDRIQLGLDLNKEADWYRHYFYDLMKWFKKNDLSSFGLTDLRAPESSLILK